MTPPQSQGWLPYRGGPLPLAWALALPWLNFVPGSGVSDTGEVAPDQQGGSDWPFTI